MYLSVGLFDTAILNTLHI